MESNQELRTAWEFIEHTDISIFLTGKAGTGKTTFLKTVKEHSMKRMIVVAPTGVAAINAGGVTIHSFFQIPLSPYIPGAEMDMRYNFNRTKRNIIRTLDMVVIDEISMVRADLLDAVDCMLRRFRDPTQPFGGVQLVMIGDLQQLTPVVTPKEAELLKSYYDTPYFFSSKALQQINYVTIMLTHVYRQNDNTFINILNDVRDGHLSPEDIERLNDRVKPVFMPKEEEGYIRLTTHNRFADNYNETKLRNLPGRRYDYQAEIEGIFPEYSYPTDVSLELKLGAQVMFVKNDPSEYHEYYNGLIGHISKISEREIEVKCPGIDRPIHVEPQVWENATYDLNPETKVIETKVQGTFRQYPLRLAWAITIHKSQGLTFERAIIDVAQAFASGQVYVAISRCKSMEGLVLTSPISNRVIINDGRVANYIAHQQEATTASIEQLPRLKEEYLKNLLLELFNFQDIYRGEQQVHRHLLEFFHDFDTLTKLHGNAIETLDKQVLKVAQTWMNVIRKMPFNALHDEEFLERVERSAGYFRRTLLDTLQELLEQTKVASSGNKQAMNRMDELYKNLLISFKAKCRLLRVMEDTPFSVPDYLKAKQETLLDAMDEVSPGSAKRSRKRKSDNSSPFEDKEPKKPKEPKIPTHIISYNLFKEGKSIEEIASERGLKESTIAGHLVRFVVSGDLRLEQFVSPEKARNIRRVIASLGPTNRLSDIKKYCPDSISYADIRFVLEYDKVKKHS
jgi:hypothetical protein